MPNSSWFNTNAGQKFIHRLEAAAQQIVKNENDKEQYALYVQTPSIADVLNEEFQKGSKFISAIPSTGDIWTTLVLERNKTT